MIVVREDGDKLHVVDRLKESVRLAAGLSADRRLDAAAADRAIACLERFGQRLRELPAGHVRAVGTNTLRRAVDAEAFMQRASTALGHPVEVIYGAEEARLIYGGVIQDLGVEHPRRLVIDIGGGSTELIIGDGATPEFMESVSLGAVAQMQRHFAKGKITAKLWEAAVTDVRLSLEPIARAYRAAGWDCVIGASGSVKSILRATGKEAADATITPADLAALQRAVIKAGRIDKLDLPGVSDERRAIFPGGLAVLSGIFESLGIEAMEVSDKALREGVIADLLGRLHDRDARESGVQAAAARYDVDRGHAEQVAATAQRLMGDAADGLTGFAARLLRWAAMLHEIGLAISHKGYHKHGDYILRHADLLGFSRSDQALLATLVRLHRGRFRDDLLLALPSDWQEVACRLAIGLRLAVILHRGRDPALTVPPVDLSMRRKRITLRCDDDWLAARPLTRADLYREAELLGRAGFKVAIDS